MSASIAIKDLTTVVYIIANLCVTYVIHLSVTHSPRNGYNARIVRDIADLSSVMKCINNRKVMALLNIVRNVAYSIEQNSRAINYYHTHVHLPNVRIAMAI